MERASAEIKVLWSNLYRNVKNIFIAYDKYRESYISYRLLTTFIKNYRYLNNLDDRKFGLFLKIRSRGNVTERELTHALIPLSINVFSKVVSKKEYLGILGLVIKGFKKPKLLSASITVNKNSEVEGLRPVMIVLNPDVEEGLMKKMSYRVSVNLWNSIKKDLMIPGFKHYDVAYLSVASPIVLASLSTKGSELNELRVVVSDGSEYRDIRIPVKKPSWRLEDLPPKLIEDIKAALINPIAKGLPFSAKGAFITGPPGVGKTVMAEALASALKLNIVELRPQNYRSMWYGATEKALNAVFQQIIKRRNEVALVIDDAEFISSRKYTIHEAHISEISTILYHLQRTDRPFTILTANNPDLIDPAVLRPGRIDVAVVLGYPDKDMRRKAILTNIKNYSIKLAGDDVLEELVKVTRWYSLAEVDAFLRLAAGKGNGSIGYEEIQWAKKKFNVSPEERRTTQEYLTWWSRKIQGIVLTYTPSENEI
ncbi:MAG: hypothetical protein B7O98_07690 [Zestosphaera tikiterensis]|uniref:AAA+ ATPase domain-containing protein n=1 Tax=Zestosphaera tikiterensis TaxID=1973259 RepID=A0A2R7Y4T0_9CREN|nr:MAG: hypothetical protein B7O98_07690 [Zestosphaera tikiterensis]